MPKRLETNVAFAGPAADPGKEPHRNETGEDGATELFSSNLLWQQTLENLPLGVAILDARSSETLWINAALHALLEGAIGTADILRQSPFKYLPGLANPNWEVALHSLSARRDGSHSSMSQRLQFVHHATRNIAYWEWALQQVGDDSAAEYLVLTVQSVSETVMNERQLAAAGRTANRARRRAEALVRLTQLVNASVTTPELLRVITEEAAAFFEAAHAAVLLLNPTTDRFEVSYSLGLNDQGASTSHCLMRTNTLAGQALSQRRTLVLTNILDHEIATPILDTGMAPTALVSSPIFRDTHNYGVVEVYFSEPRDIPVDARTLLAAFADQTAIALHKADLYEEIAEGKRQLQSIFDNAPVGIIYFDTDGRVMAANASAGEKYDRTPADMVGSTIITALTDIPEGLFAIVRDGAPFHASHSVFHRADQKEVVCDLSLLPVRDEVGRVVGVLLLTFEVTELVTAQKEADAAREAAENLLAQAEATQTQMVQIEKMRAIGELASGVAHDFNNALMAILGYTELSEDSLDDPEALSKYLGIIRKSAEDATKTVQRLQRFARQRVAPRNERIDISAIVKDAYDITRPRWKDAAQKEGKTYNLALQLEPTAEVLAEQSGLREVLVNVIYNALNAMPDGGDLTLSTRQRGKDKVEIEVADTGVGMTPEVMARIFDPFFTTRGTEGTGLGLAVSWSIIQNFGGTIDVESAPGIGSRFFLRLPVGSAPITPLVVRPKEAIAASATSGGHVLVVDDEPFIASVLSSILTRHGYRASVVHSAEEALEKLTNKGPRFDLVLTDHGMPGMNGLQLIAELRGRWPDIPVVLLTGWGETLLQTYVAEALPDKVLGKPINQTDLLDAIAEVLRNRSLEAVT